MDAAWIGVIGGLGGVALGAMFSRTSEHATWLRNERLRVASELLAAGQAALTLFSERHVAGLYEGAEFGEPERRKARIACEERLVLATQSFRIAFPDRVALLAEEFCDSARKIRSVRLEDPDIDLASPGFRFFDRLEALTAAVRPLIVRRSLRERLALKLAPKADRGKAQAEQATVVGNMLDLH